MLKELLNKQQLYLNYFFKSIDIEPIEALVKKLMNCSGIVFFSGVGKSGLIAKKIALTMASTGTKSIYLSPTDALHGDLGLASAQDIFILLSKSGESDELMSLVPAIQNKGATLIGIVCNDKSRLATACDLTITLPFEYELCPYDMAPTMSTSFQLLFGDLISIALMREKNFSLSQYALNHPSGRIGKRITLRVKDIMLKNDRIPFCQPNDLLKSILVELSNKRCGCVLVVDKQKKLQGIFTDGDLRRTLQQQGSDILNLTMQEVMTCNPSSVTENQLVWESMKKMEADQQKRITVLPVINEESCVVGLLHLHDIIQAGLY